MKRLPQLLIDLLQEDKLWHDLHTIIHDHTEEHVTNFIRVLERARIIDQNSDPEIVEESIRTIGLDIHSDIMEINGNAIRNSFYQLSKFYTINSNKHYPRFIEFLLGRGFSVGNLYTENYIDFYPQPLGVEIADGGTWFSTTHVDLTVAGSGLARYLSINIGAGDIQALKTRLQYDRMTELEKDDFDNTLQELMGRVLLETDDPRFVEAMIDIRISELFYEYAPIEEVIHSIYLGLYSSADLYVSMSALAQPVDYYNAENIWAQSLTILLPNSVNSGTVQPARVQIGWSDGTSTTESALDWSDSESLLDYDGTIVFRDPELSSVQSTRVTARAFGVVGEKQVSVVAFGVPLIPSTLRIWGPRIAYGQSRQEYRLQGQYGDYWTDVPDPETVQWTSSAGTMNRNFLVVDRIVEDEQATVTAQYLKSNGVTDTVNLSVDLVANLLKAVPVRIIPQYYQVTIVDGIIVSSSPATEFVQGNTYQVRTEIVYSDGTTAVQGSLISSRSVGVPIDSDGVFDLPPVYADFTLTLDISYSEDEEELNLTVELPVRFPRIELQSIEVSGPDTVIEGQTAVYTAVATWSNGQKSTVPEALWSSPDILQAGSLVRGIEIDSMGRVVAPVLGRNEQSVVVAQTQRFPDGVLMSASKAITIVNQVRTINAITALSADSVNEGSYISLNFFSYWSDGSTTQVLPDLVELLDEDDVVVATATRVGTSMQYSNTGLLLFANDPDAEFVDDETGQTHPVMLIRYVNGTVKPRSLHELRVSYTADRTVMYSRPLVAVPRVIKATQVEYSLPRVLQENRRYFVAALATYEDSSVQEVEAVWSVTDLESQIEDLPVELSQGKFTLEAIVEALTGYDRDTLLDMVVDGQNFNQSERNKLLNGDRFFDREEHRPIAGQTWPEKLGILFAQYEGVPFYRVAVQTRYVDEDEEFVLFCDFYSLQANSVHTVENAPVEPHDRIKSWYLYGPVEIEANASMMYSYSLIVDYDDTGEEYAVSNDWEVDLYADDTFDQRREIIRYLVDVDGQTDILPLTEDGSGARIPVDQLTQEQMLTILPTNSVVDIDEDGYLYPIRNVNARIVVKALYDDGLSQFEDTIVVYMKRVNTVLQGMNMYLVDQIGQRNYSFGNLIVDEANAWSFNNGDVLYYQLGTELTRVDEPTPVPPPGIVLWRAEPTGSGISFDEATGRLFVSPQTNDSQIKLTATYTEEFRESDTSQEVFSETVSAVYSVFVTAHRALDQINMIGPLFAQDDEVFYPNAAVIRRDGTQADVFRVLDWQIVSAPAGTIKESQFGIRVPKLEADSSMTLRAVATEGTRIITRDFVFNLLAGFIPEELIVTDNPQGHRDTSSIGLIAKLRIRNNPVPVDATGSVSWLLDTRLTGLRLEGSNLIAPHVDEDVRVYLRAAYNSPNLVQPVREFNILLQSSYPIYWTAPNAPINTANFMARFDGGEFKRLTSDRGGRFSFIPNSDEYIYFAHPAHYGTARFALVPSTTDPVDWGNMQAPVTVQRTYLNGVVEDWLVYRSINRGFGQTELSVVYER